MSGAHRELDLFDMPARVPDGFIYRQEFISPTEEAELIGEIHQLQLAPFKYYKFTGKRRTVSFGWLYEFGAPDITRGAKIPEWLLPLRARAEPYFGIAAGGLVQASIIEYSTGSPIGWHRDIPQFGDVIGISLAASCRMRFRKYVRQRAKSSNRDDILSVELQPRSIYLMSGAARETWQHSIPPVKQLRYAIMMRTLRPKLSRIETDRF
jgi:alkylated DNA repair dioxygenase AlkB